MNEPIKRRPQAGDTVRIEGWQARFAVIDVGERVCLLESENGTRIQARVELLEVVQEKAA